MSHYTYSVTDSGMFCCEAVIINFFSARCNSFSVWRAISHLRTQYKVNSYKAYSEATSFAKCDKINHIDFKYQQRKSTITPTPFSGVAAICILQSL